MDIVPQPFQTTYLSDSYQTITINTQLEVIGNTDKLNSVLCVVKEQLFNEVTSEAAGVLGEENHYSNKIVINLLSEYENKNEKIKNEKESYEIYSDTERKEVHIQALSHRGVFYAFQTLCQISASNNHRIGHFKIVDFPNTEWRGFHLDVARHFLDLHFVKKLISLAAFYKLNRFHWHLTEDQGWRVEIKGHPLLTEIGAWRAVRTTHKEQDRLKQEYRCEICPNDPKEREYGGFYTQEEIKDVIQYAKLRNITVIPEIDIPGHSLSALAAYSFLGCKDESYQVETKWGIMDKVLCAGKQATYQFYQDVFDEICALFPGKYIHIGGDECLKKRWKTCPNCQDFMKNHSLNNEEELQRYFVEYFVNYLASKHNKIVVGWDEILEGNLSNNGKVIIMAWRAWGNYLKQSLDSNFPLIMTPTTHAYLDFRQTKDKDDTGVNRHNALITLEKIYEFPLHNDKVLGGQVNMWTEYTPCSHAVEYMMFPRVCAFSQALWLPSSRLPSFSNFKSSLSSHLVHFYTDDLEYTYTREFQLTINKDYFHPTREDGINVYLSSFSRSSGIDVQTQMDRFSSIRTECSTKLTNCYSPSFIRQRKYISGDGAGTVTIDMKSAGGIPLEQALEEPFRISEEYNNTLIEIEYDTHPCKADYETNSRIFTNDTVDFVTCEQIRGFYPDFSSMDGTVVTTKPSGAVYLERYVAQSIWGGDLEIQFSLSYRSLSDAMAGTRLSSGEFSFTMSAPTYNVNQFTNEQREMGIQIYQAMLDDVGEVKYPCSPPQNISSFFPIDSQSEDSQPMASTDASISDNPTPITISAAVPFPSFINQTSFNIVVDDPPQVQVGSAPSVKPSSLLTFCFCFLLLLIVKL